MKQAAIVARAVLGAALVAGMLLGGCEGNVNDDDVPVLPIDLVSYNDAGSLAKRSCYCPSVSRDGRYVAFSTYASLHPLDTNSEEDIYVRDLVDGRTILVSINALWTNGGNDYSETPRIDPGGRFVAFLSYADNLLDVSGFNEVNYAPDIYVHDLQTGVTMPVSVNPAENGMVGVDWNCIPDLLQFDGDEDGIPDELYVVFHSRNNVLGDGSSYDQIYVRKMWISDFTRPLTLTKIQHGQTYRISRDSWNDSPADNDWGNGNSINPVLATWPPNNKFLTVAWQSDATDLLGDPSTDTNGHCDIYVRVFDRSNPSSGTTIRVSRAYGSDQGGDGDSTVPVISEDGRYVAFVSEATDLTSFYDFNGQPDVYVFGPLGGTAETRLVSEGALGMANNASITAGISADGRYIVFSSNASNLVEGDTNGATDVFLKDMDSGTLSRVSLTVFGAEPAGQSGYMYDTGGADISGDGRAVFFQSSANNILPGITLFESQQIYRRKY